LFQKKKLYSLLYANDNDISDNIATLEHKGHLLNIGVWYWWVNKLVFLICYLSLFYLNLI